MLERNWKELGAKIESCWASDLDVLGTELLGAEAGLY
jgi:hypothetical protein